MESHHIILTGEKYEGKERKTSEVKENLGGLSKNVTSGTITQRLIVILLSPDLESKRELKEC